MNPVTQTTTILFNPMSIPNVTPPTEVLSGPAAIQAYLQRFVYSAALVLIYDLPLSTANVENNFDQILHYAGEPDLDHSLVFHSIQLVQKLRHLKQGHPQKTRKYLKLDGSVNAAEFNTVAAKKELARVRKYMNGRGWDIVSFAYKMGSIARQFVTSSVLMRNSLDRILGENAFNAKLLEAFREEYVNLSANCITQSANVRVIISADAVLRSTRFGTNHNVDELVLFMAHLSSVETRELVRSMMRVTKDIDGTQKPRGWSDATHGEADTSTKSSQELNILKVILYLPTRAASERIVVYSDWFDSMDKWSQCWNEDSNLANLERDAFWRKLDEKMMKAHRSVFALDRGMLNHLLLV